ncbi:MAG: hypothetical protein JNK75_00285 [Betaproteobacteria bacterium]|nr:hypothetical protein [Betaproteobacteria bacterium]
MLVTDEVSVILGATAAMAGNEILVSLPGLPDNKRVHVAIATVNGTTLNASAPAGYLVGDVNRTRSVTPQDLTAAKGRAGQFAQPGNFQFDLNASGSITAADLAALKARSGRNLPNAGPPVVARIEIEQTGLLLDAMGTTRQLTANAYNAAGQKLNVPVTWTSSRPANLTVNGTGLVTAQTGNGVSQITVSAGGKVSAPLIAVVTQPAIGAVLLNDSQIVGDPVETTPGAAPSFTNTYRVNLTGVAAPAVGTILINTESKQVAGRVVAVDASGSPIMVTLALEPLPVLFPNLVINETIDLTNAPIKIEPDIAATYDVVRTGNTFTFTPKSAGMKAPAMANANSRSGDGATVRRADAPVPAAQVPPFKSCETTITGFTPNAAPPVALVAPPIFSITINPSFDIVYDNTLGLQRFVINAEPTIKFEGSIGLTVAFEGKLECKATLFKFLIPSSIPLIGGMVPVGVGFEAGGKFTLATLAIGAKVEVKTRAKAGISCPAGVNCVFERALDNFEVKTTPILDLPSIGDVRLEPSFSVFGFAEPNVGFILLSSLQFDFLKLKAGAKLAGSFASMTSQLADAMYASDYKVSLEAGASLGGSANAVLTALGISSLSGLELAISTDVAKSPTGLASGAVTADKATFVFGDTVNFTVKLDPATLGFFPGGIGPYNVKKVMLVRDNGLLPSVVSSVNAVPGDHTFNLTYLATGPGNVNEFSAFVVTWLAPLDVFALEIGRAAAASTDFVSVRAVVGIPGCGVSGDSHPQTVQSETVSMLGPGGFPLVATIGPSTAVLEKVDANTIDAFFESTLDDAPLTCPEPVPSPAPPNFVFSHAYTFGDVRLTVFFPMAGTLRRISYNALDSMNPTAILSDDTFPIDAGTYLEEALLFGALGASPGHSDDGTPLFSGIERRRFYRFVFTPAPPFP